MEEIIGYRTLKFLHLAGVVLFLGNLIVTATWKVMADRTGNPVVIAYAQRLVTVTDIVFTGLGAGLVFITGLLMAQEFGEQFWRLAWLGWGIGLFALSGMLWCMVLIPVQLRQAALARDFASGGPIPGAYWRLSRVWNLVGFVATVLPFANLYLMVFRPE